MQRIRDAQTVIASLEDGKCIQALSAELTKTLAALQEQSGGHHATKQVKGFVNLKLDIVVVNGTATITADISSKCPKEHRGPSMFWVLDDGALTTEHPQQASLFAGLREVESA